MMRIVYPECLNMHSRMGKIHPISKKDNPHTGTVILTVQKNDSRKEKLIPVAREDNSCTGIVHLASLEYDSCEGKIVQRVGIDDFSGVEVVLGHG